MYSDIASHAAILGVLSLKHDQLRVGGSRGINAGIDSSVPVPVSILLPTLNATAFVDGIVCGCMVVANYGNYDSAAAAVRLSSRQWQT